MLFDGLVVIALIVLIVVETFDMFGFILLLTGLKLVYVWLCFDIPLGGVYCLVLFGCDVLF